MVKIAVYCLFLIQNLRIFTTGGADMKIKRIIHVATSYILILCFISIIVSTNSISVFAQEIEDYPPEERAKDFLTEIYEVKNFNYSNLEISYSVELYDNEDDVIGVAVILERDDEIDYVIYNCITQSIDEYGFDYAQALTDFPRDEKVYYAGALNYYTEIQNEFVNNYTGQKFDRGILFDKIEAFKTRSQARVDALFGGGGNPENAEDGFVNWSDIAPDRLSGWTNSDWGYLEGIGFGGILDTNGINGVGLSFSSMNSLNPTGVLKNHCGPTALTNIMIYYNWLGMDTLINNSRQSTFDRMRELSNHDGTNYTSMTDLVLGLTEHMYDKGYGVSVNPFFNNFSKYKEAIDRGNVVLTLLNITDSSGSDWGHFVVTLGYEEFRQQYEEKFLWWTVTGYNYLRYIRVCDGWNSCNQNRFVDLNEFYDTYTNVEISIS